MTIHIVTFWKDFQWLPYLLKSIHRYCTGFNEIILMVPNRDANLLRPFNLTRERVITYDEVGDGHIHHCYMKMTADIHTPDSMIVHFDSDCVFTAPTNPDYFIRDGKPMLLYTPFCIKEGKEWPSHWRKGSEQALGHKVEVETMRRHGACYNRDTYLRCRDHIKSVHGKPLLEYLSPFKRGDFSEFCTLGGFAYYHEPENYFLINADDAPPKTHHQFWSFHGVNHPEVRAKLKEFDLL